jgi:acyl-CoA dehydrogenase
MHSPDSSHCNPANRDETYLVDMAELDFFLWEQFPEHEELLKAGPHHVWDREKYAQVLEQAHKFALKLGRAYQSSDKEGCALDGEGGVRLPSAYPALWEEFRAHWVSAKTQARNAVAETDPMQPILPPMLGQLVYEMFMGSNPSFMTYGGFSRPASKIIYRAGTPQQKEAFFNKLHLQEWDACFCSSEPQAGSDVTAIGTVGSPVEGDVYSIVGEKRFISAGMHQLTDNTLYFVLGRADTATPGSFSMSCFIVPKYWTDAEGRRRLNNVECLRLEDKMGLNGCANTHLRFGHQGPTYGYLLGNRKNVGLLQLMPLMSEARMSTGLFALGMASSAYNHALRYARSRVQGRPFNSVSDVNAERVNIIEHLDVQRMLLEMKSKVEGCRGLLGKMSIQYSRQLAIREKAQREKDRGEPGKPDQQADDRAQRLIQFYVPIVKAYVSDQAWRICELAIQVHGGVGYTKDTPVEQYARDVKVLSIWEGTNYIQSQDLLRDKLSFGRDSRTIQYFCDEVREFLDNTPPGELAEEFQQLREALAACVSTLEVLGEIVKDGQMTHVSQFSTRLLEMLAEVCLGWVLLEAAVAAQRGLREQGPKGAKAAFYLGKLDSARFFIHNILPAVHSKAGIIRNHARSLVVTPSERFGYLEMA